MVLVILIDLVTICKTGKIRSITNFKEYLVYFMFKDFKGWLFFFIWSSRAEHYAYIICSIFGFWMEKSVETIYLVI